MTNVKDSDEARAAMRSALARTGALEVDVAGEDLEVERVRRLPSRGIFRLIIPRVVARVTLGSRPSMRTRPDAIAWFVIVALVGGVLVELTMDRARYPRGYPPAFVYVSAALYLGALAIEGIRTARAVRGALAAHGVTLALLLVVLAACGEAPVAHRFEREVADRIVRDAHPRADGALDLVLETPVHMAMEPGPRRALVRVAADGTETLLLDSTRERALLDVAPHPSGEATALFASSAGFELVRLDASGATVATTPIVDAAIDADPPVIPGAPPADPIERFARDVGRIEPVGEDVIAATRTGRHSVIAYRFGWDGAAFAPAYRTLVVPPHGVIAVGLTGGSYDIFGQVANPHVVYLDVDEDGLAYVATTYELASPDNVVEAHEEVFGETLVGDLDHADGYVTRVDVDGTRLGTSVITTELEDQLYGLRAARGAAYVLGRNEIWNASGTGHDALVARVDAVTGAVETFAFDVRDGDIAFDAALTGAGELVVFGASGYSQNPQGASVSDASEAFARVFAADGSTRDLPLPTSARHDVPFVVRDLGRGALLVGGMLDGPGTHTADADITRLYARGFVTTLVP